MLGENTALSEKRGAASTARVPSTLCDRFVLEERLEQGRLGTMYRALDRLRGQEGRSYVAVLVLPTEIAASPEQLAAFDRALGGVRLLSHPNIVRIFSLERDGPTAFVVLEWVDGESLRAVIDSLAPETVCEADALGVVRAVGNALVYAHARGVVHGDVRPENVLVTERGEVRLLFTPACLAGMSPFTLGARDDVRGLAALAYELMAGSRPPIAGLYPRGKADEPEPIDGLSRKRWKALRSALSVRDGRISSVRRFLAALDLPEPRAPRAGSRPDRVRDAGRGRLKRVAIAFGACAGLAALAAGGAWLWSERADSLPDLRGLPAAVETGTERAAQLTREGWSGTRDRLGRAGSALSALWTDVSERVSAASTETAAAPAGTETPERFENDAIRATELFEREEFNGIGDVVDEAPVAAGESAAPEESVAVPAEEVPAQPEEVVGSAEEVPAQAEDSESAALASARVSAPEPSSAARATNVQAAAVADAPPLEAPRIAFSQSEYLVSESEGVAAIEVVRADARGEVSFVWWTRDASAVSGDDYADLGRRVEQFRNGETVKVLYVPITSDSIEEDRREYFELLLGVLSAEGNQNGALESARVTIVDDDR